MSAFTPAVRWRLRLAAGLIVALAATTGCLHKHKQATTAAAEDECCDDAEGKCKKCGKHKCHGKCGIDNCADIPKGAIPTHPGTYVNAYLNKSADKAELDDFVLYYNEFKDSEPVLGPFGRRHLAQIIARLPTVPFPVVIQPTPDHLKATNTPYHPEDKDIDPRQLDQARRKAVVDLLCQAKIPNAEERVVVGIPTAEGLFGEEGERIYPMMLQNQLGGFGGGFGAYGGLGGFGGGFGGLGGFGGGFGGGFLGGLGGFGGGFIR
jgi:hypothetical protein